MRDLGGNSVRKPRKCPECGSKRVATILYGLRPAPDDALQKRLDAGTATFGGCCIETDSPTWICSDCGITGGRLDSYGQPRTIE